MIEKTHNPIGEILDSLLEEAAMDETGDYLTRGRSLRELDDGQLKVRWTAAIKAFWQEATRERERDLDDTGAELRLRGAEPPYETVSGELAALRAEISREEYDSKGRAALRARIRELLAKRENQH